MPSFSSRLEKLERDATPRASKAALPEHLVRLVGRGAIDDRPYMTLLPLTGGRGWYAWPPGPFDYGHMAFGEVEVVPAGAVLVTPADRDLLTAAGVLTIAIEYADDWGQHGAARETAEA